MNMEIERICRKCGHISPLNNTNVHTATAYLEGQEEYTIKYYQCERCNETHILQIDNKETLKMLQTYTEKLIYSLQTQNMTPRKQNKLKGQLSILSRNLKAKRDDLNAYCSGLNFYEKDGTFMAKVLTNAEGGGIIEM